MKYQGRPFRTTILYGLFASVAFLTVNLLGWFWILWPAGKYLFAWLALAGYGLLLTRWSGKSRFRMLLYFLALLFIFILARSELVMVLSGLLMLGWVRSRFCFPVGWAKAIGIELVIGLGGFLLVSFLAPGAPTSQALGVMIFFLVQAGYFVIFDRRQEVSAKKVVVDTFIKAQKEVESILSPEPF